MEIIYRTFWVKDLAIRCAVASGLSRLGRHGLCPSERTHCTDHSSTSNFPKCFDVSLFRLLKVLVEDRQLLSPTSRIDHPAFGAPAAVD